jgi:hypothetical protein
MQQLSLDDVPTELKARLEAEQVAKQIELHESMIKNTTTEVNYFTEEDILNFDKYNMNELLFDVDNPKSFLVTKAITLSGIYFAFCEVLNLAPYQFNIWCLEDPVNSSATFVETSFAEFVTLVGIEHQPYLAKKNNIYIIEDAAQAFGVKFKKKYLGTFGDIGVFSMSMTKALCAGQGGFLVVNNEILAKKLKIMRNQGAVNVFKISVWKNFGFNFKITDMQSAIALSQLKKIKKHVRKMKNNFILYENLLKNFSNYIFPAFLDHKKGESPLYNEFICKNRRHLMNYLKTNNIETREFYPNFDKVKYMKIQKGKFPNSRIYQNNSLYLPSGPNLKLEEIKRTTKFIKNFYS